ELEGLPPFAIRVAVGADELRAHSHLQLDLGAVPLALEEPGRAGVAPELLADRHRRKLQLQRSSPGGMRPDAATRQIVLILDHRTSHELPVIVRTAEAGTRERGVTKQISVADLRGPERARATALTVNERDAQRGRLDACQEVVEHPLQRRVPPALEPETPDAQLALTLPAAQLRRALTQDRDLQHLLEA